MKYLLLISSLIFINIANSQNQNKFEKTFSNKPDAAGLNSLLKNKGQKSQTWNWDTIVTFHTSGLMSDRYTQTFDTTGRVLTIQLERWENNIWNVNDRYVFAYDINGYKTLKLHQLWFGQWNDYSQDEYTYDNNGNLLFHLYKENSVNKDRSTYTYNNANKMLTMVSESWQNNAWVNTFRLNSEYDSNNRILHSTYEDWQNNLWRITDDYSFSYDVNGNKLSNIYLRIYDDTLRNYERELYTYDPNENNIFYIQELGQDTIWKNFVRRHSYFDNNGNRTNDKVEQFINNAWTSMDSIINTYDINNKLTCNIEMHWQNDTLKNNRKESFTYDSNGQKLTDLIENWKNDIWTKFQRYSYTYDSNGKTLIYLIEDYDPNNDSVASNYHRYTNTYDAQDNLLSYHCEAWELNSQPDEMYSNYTYDMNNNSISGIFEETIGGNLVPYDGGPLYIFSNTDSLFYIFDFYRYEAHFTNNFSGIQNNTVENSLSLFPNPAQDYIYVQNVEPKSTVSIYSLDGKVLLQNEIDNSTMLNVHSLAKGSYIVKVTDNDSIRVKKLIKE